MGFWSELWRSESRDWMYRPFTPVQPIPANTRYVSIELRRMHIVNSRAAYRRFYGAVQSYSSIPRYFGENSEFTTLSTPKNLKDVDAKSLGRMIIGNQRIVGPTPYRGGDVSLEIALFSVRSQDMLEEFLDIMDNLSSAAGVAYYSVAKPFVGPIKKGFDLLTGTPGNSTLEIGVAETVTQLQSGVFVAARIDQRSSGNEGYQLSPDYRLVAPSGEEVRDAPYLVFEVTADPVRDDWFKIPEIELAHTALRDAVRTQRSLDEIESLERTFRRVVLTSSDILPAHGRQVVDEIGAELRDILPSALTDSSGDGPRMRNLSVLVLSAVQA